MITRFSQPVLIIFALSLSGCSRSAGVYIVPEHKELGLIKDSLVAVAEFEVFNGLDHPLTIKHIYPSCQCTTVGLVKNPIPAGKSTILRAEAKLSDRGGKQTFSVALLTDSPEFPIKQVQFEALVPATGDHQRHLSIGSFYSGQKIALELPTTSFTQGSVEIIKCTNDSTMTTHLANRQGEPVLVVKGAAPNTVGIFSWKVLCRESFPKEPLLGEGSVELELVGDVVSRWIVKPEVYAGFVSLDKNEGLFSLSIERNPLLSEQRERVSNVFVTSSEEWLSLTRQSTSLGEIELEFKVNRNKLKHFGALQNAIKLKVEYKNGESESYSATLFIHVDP